MKLKRKEDHLSFRRNFSSSEKKASNNSGLYAWILNQRLALTEQLLNQGRPDLWSDSFIITVHD